MWNSRLRLLTRKGQERFSLLRRDGNSVLYDLRSTAEAGRSTRILLKGDKSSMANGEDLAESNWDERYRVGAA
jgi:hypothetical protein